MESRRSRAIVQAYLRGLTRPDYPNGIKSYVREELILSAVMSEIEHDQMVVIANVKAAVASKVDSKNISKYIRGIQIDIENAFKFRVMHINGMAREDKNIDDLAKLYKMLGKIGIIPE